MLQCSVTTTFSVFKDASRFLTRPFIERQPCIGHWLLAHLSILMFNIWFFLPDWICTCDWMKYWHCVFTTRWMSDRAALYKEELTIFGFFFLIGWHVIIHSIVSLYYNKMDVWPGSMLQYSPLLNLFRCHWCRKLCSLHPLRCKSFALQMEPVLNNVMSYLLGYSALRKISS